MAKSRCIVKCSLPAVVISRRACVLGSPPCKANDPEIDDAATWQQMPKTIRRREPVERVVPVSMSIFLLSFVSKVSREYGRADRSPKKHVLAECSSAAATYGRYSNPPLVGNCVASRAIDLARILDQ